MKTATDRNPWFPTMSHVIANQRTSICCRPSVTSPDPNSLAMQLKKPHLQVIGTTTIWINFTIRRPVMGERGALWQAIRWCKASPPRATEHQPQHDLHSAGSDTDRCVCAIIDTAARAATAGFGGCACHAGFSAPVGIRVARRAGMQRHVIAPWTPLTRRWPRKGR